MSAGVGWRLRRVRCGPAVGITTMLVLVLALAAPAAHASTCRVSTVGVAFGTYDVFSTVDLDSTGQVTVSCRGFSGSYSIALSAGAGTFASRTMTNGGLTLAYNLFADAQRLTIWGDGSAGTVTVTGTGTGQSFTIYGRIPARQNAQAASYADSITVTVTY